MSKRKEQQFTLYQGANYSGGTDLVVINDNHAVAYLHANPEGVINFIDKLKEPISLKKITIGFFIRNWRAIAIGTMKAEAKEHERKHSNIGVRGLATEPVEFDLSKPASEIMKELEEEE